MTAITIRSFGGMNPITTAKNLPDNAAQVSTNTYLSKGSIKPWKAGAKLLDKTRSGTINSIFRYGDGQNESLYWFEFNGDVDVQKGPIGSDMWQRVYYTGDGYPKYTLQSLANVTAPYPTGHYRLGVPAPITAPIGAVSGSPTDENDLEETRVYVYTYVTAYGEEGVPSQASIGIDMKPGQTVTLTGLASAPTGAYNIATKRIYRSNTGTTGAIYQFVAEIGVSVTTYVDNIANGDLSEENATGNFDMPDQNMIGITGMANGILAGFFDKTLCLSEPFLPHAWPLEYRLSTEHKIVGIGAFGQSLAVLTESYPYVATGVDPESMTLEKLPLQQACVSKRSIVEMGAGVIYASPDGLFSIGANGITSITQSLMTREEWQSYNPSSILGAQYDGRYFAFYDNGTKGCMVFSFNGVEPTFCTLDLHATAAFNDALTDTLYLVVNNDIVKFNYGTALTYTWKSKNFLMQQPQNFGAGQVISKSYPITFKFYADGALKHTQTVGSVAPFRLPSGFLSTEFEFQVEGTGEVEQVSLASSMSELRSV